MVADGRGFVEQYVIRGNYWPTFLSLRGGLCCVQCTVGLEPPGPKGPGFLKTT
jgi:hypothetical protein